MQLEIASRRLTRQFVSHAREGYPEANRDLNRASRGLVRAMLSENGGRPVWIWELNPPNKAGAIVREYRAGMVYNFSGSFITPCYDTKLARMIRERLGAPYTGTAADSVRVDAIFEQAEAIGAKLLHWS